MPIYEYRCSECGFQDEFLQKLSDPLMTVCPSCGKESLTKLLSAAGFQLKGSGWYATDFKGSGSKPAAKSEGAKAAEGASSEGKPGEAAGGDKAAAKPSSDTAAADKSPRAKAAPAGTSG